MPQGTRTVEFSGQPADGPFRILHLTDLHFTREHLENPNARKGYDLALAQIELLAQKAPVHLIAVTGDLVEGRDWSLDEHKDCLNLVKSYLKKLCISLKLELEEKLLVVPGNHDWKFSGFKARGPDFQRAFEEVFPEYDRPRLFVRGGMRLFVACINSNKVSGPLELATGTVSMTDIDSLEKELSQIDPSKEPLFRMALVHHHPLPVPDSEILDPQTLAEKIARRKLDGAPEFMLLRNGGVFLERLLRARFNLVLHGHLHVGNYWGPVYGVTSHDNWLEVIASGSFCDCAGRHAFSLVEIDDGGCITCVEHLVKTNGMISSRQRQAMPYEVVRSRHAAICANRTSWNCDAQHVIVDIELPAGDVLLTEHYFGLYNSEQKDQKDTAFCIPTKSSTLTRIDCSFESPNNEVEFSTRGLEAGFAKSSIEHVLNFRPRLTIDHKRDLLCRRSITGAMFSSRECQHLFGGRGPDAKDWFTYRPLASCKQVHLTLRFRGAQLPPGSVEVIAQQKSDDSFVPLHSETLYAQSQLVYSLTKLPIQNTNQAEHSDAEASLVLRTPMVGCEYLLRWKIPDEEPIDVTERAALTDIRQRMLEIHKSQRKQKLVHELLETVLRITHKLSQRPLRGGRKDEQLGAALFAVHEFRESGSGAPVKLEGAVMKCIGCVPANNVLGLESLLWGRDVVGRAARSGVWVSLDRERLNRLKSSVEILHKLPPQVQLLFATPLFCYKADKYPSAVLAIGTTRTVGPLRAIVGNNTAERELAELIMEAWLLNFDKIVGIPRVLGS